MASDDASNTLVLLLCFQMSFITCVTRSDRVCLELQLGKQDIQAIGLLTRRFVLLTKQGYLYDLPPNVFQPSDRVLYLSDDVLLKDKWPLLDKYIVSNQSVVTLSDAEHDYILTMKQSDKKTSLYAYNIDNDTMLTSTATKLPYNNQSISSSEKLVFYSVQSSIDQAANHQIRVHICNLTGSTEINGTTAKVEASFFLCINEDCIAMLSALPSEHVCTSDVTFHSGFTDGQQFYLFVDSSVYIFEHSTIITGKWVSGDKVELKDFFVCGRLGTSNNVMKWLTVAWLINLCITLFFIFSLIICVHCIQPLITSAKSDNQGASSRKQSSLANLKLSSKPTNATIITKQRGSDQKITVDRNSTAVNSKNK